MRADNTRPTTTFRPKILIGAAQICAQNYRRGRTVARLVSPGQRNKQSAVIDALRQAEAEANAARKQGDITYSIRRHIDLLAALIAEQSSRAKR